MKAIPAGVFSKEQEYMPGLLFRKYPFFCNFLEKMPV